MKLSIVIPWRDTGCEWRFRSVRWIAQRYVELMPAAELIFGGRDAPCQFNRAHARNQAVQRSTGDLLLIADADTIFEFGQLQRGIAAIEQGAPWVIPYALGRYYNLSADCTTQVWAENPAEDIPEPTDPRFWEHKIDSWAGLLLVPRAAFDAVGGYDERFNGWGYEDNAFRAALDHRVGHHTRIDGYALHLWHPVSDAETFGQPSITQNRELYHQYESGVLP